MRWNFYDVRSAMHLSAISFCCASICNDVWIKDSFSSAVRKISVLPGTDAADLLFGHCLVSPAGVLHLLATAWLEEIHGSGCIPGLLPR